jgi:hypothetical protein
LIRFFAKSGISFLKFGLSPQHRVSPSLHLPFLFDRPNFFMDATGFY